MAEKFQNKYRIQSARLQTWNYRRNATYFVTICTRHRACYFGEIANGAMVLSEIGQIVESEWLKTFDLRPDMNLIMGAYVVMPNHFHAIIVIGENEYNTPSCVSTSHCHFISKQNKFGPQSKNLSSVIRGFKSAVTVNARKIRADFGWQPRFHDHIIRDSKGYGRIEQYIVDNPRNWNADTFNCGGKK